MKRKETTLGSSSSRRETTPENHHEKTIGCMSGIFRFLSKYQNRRKLLTAGRKHEKSAVSSEPSNRTPRLVEKHKKTEPAAITPIITRFSCEVLRSPTIPAEIRQSNSTTTRRNIQAPPPALMARLMGLEGIPESLATHRASSSEKRMKLLGALEKCNEDLQVLKTIIEAAITSQSSGSGPVMRVDRGVFGDTEKKNEQPSPVSVLDQCSRSPLNNYSQRQRCDGKFRLRPQQQQQQQQQRKKPGEEDIFSLCVFNKLTSNSFKTKIKNCKLPTWGIRAMVVTVDEVCKDAGWGERREVKRIGLVIHDYIYKDLIEEIVRDMWCGYYIHSLPLEACKKRLCF